MKKIFLVMFLVVGIHLFAADAQELVKAHKEALKVYKSQDRNVTKSIEILKQAGVEEILKEKPKGMTQGQYVQLLNDYGFFLQQSTNFKNVSLVLNGFPYVYDKKVTINERYLKFEHMKNFGPRVENLCQSINYFDRVIKLSPNREVAYLNLADSYWKLFLYRSKIIFRSDLQKISSYTKDCKKYKTGYKRAPLPSERDILFSEELLARKAFLLYKQYAKLRREKNKTKKLPNRVHDFLKRPKRYIVLYDESPATGDATVCQDLQKAFDRFDCLECKDNLGDESRSTNLWLYKNLMKLNAKFTPIYEPTVYKYFYSHGKKDKKGRGMFHYKYKDNIYIFGNAKAVNFSYWSKRIAEEGAQRAYEYKCKYSYINLKQKNRWENEL